jgi:hypothetical protein
MNAMTSRRAQSRTAMLVLAGLLVGCAPEDAARKTAAQPSPACAGDHATQRTPTQGGAVSTDTDGVVRIQLKIGDDIVTATLNDTPPAREFAAMLPTTISMHELLNQEKAGELPRDITVDGAQRESTYEVGEIGYWAPGNDIAIVYAGGGRPIPQPGLVRLGTVDGGLDVVAAAGDEFEMTVERCD